MKHWRFAIVALILCGVWTASRAEIIGGGFTGVFKPSGGGTCDATHGPPSGLLPHTGGGNYSGHAADVTTVVNLMCGLVTDGLLSSASSGYCGTLFDLFYFFSVTVNTDAHLNLCTGTTFTTVEHGGPTFTANVGFNGVASTGTIYLDTTFNVSSSGNFSRNDAHVSLWNNSQVAIGFSPGGVQDGNTVTGIFPKFSDNNSYWRINDGIGSPSGGAAQASAVGHFLATRSAGSTQAQYYNGSAVAGISSVASGAVPNLTYPILSTNLNGTFTGGSSQVVCSYTLGTHFTSAQAAFLAARLATAHAAESCT